MVQSLEREGLAAGKMPIPKSAGEKWSGIVRMAAISHKFPQMEWKAPLYGYEVMLVVFEY